jgi:hypothetical protein
MRRYELGVRAQKMLRDDGAEDPLYVSRKKQSPVNDTGFVQWRANITLKSGGYVETDGSGCPMTEPGRPSFMVSQGSRSVFRSLFDPSPAARSGGASSHTRGARGAGGSDHSLSKPGHWLQRRH